MDKFAYIAHKSNGERETGAVTGTDMDDALGQLQAKGLVVVSLIPFSVGKKDVSAEVILSNKPKQRFTHNAIKSHDLVLLARQLALLLNSGVSLLRCIDILMKQVDSQKLNAILESVRKEMEGGKTLRDCLAKYPDSFSPLWINLIETGEASGNLPMVLEKLAYYLEETAAFRSKIISALVYPGVLLSVSFLAIFFFILKIVPTFSTILLSFDVELPLATKILINMSDVLRKQGLWVIVGVVVIVWAFRRISKRPPFDRLLERALFKVPIAGEFYRFILLERFATTTSILIESGVPILYALEISERSAESIRMAEIIQFVKKSVKEGHSMAMPMEKTDFFPPMVVQMVAIGEEIGELVKILKRIAVYYQDYLTVAVGRVTTLVEPIMIIFVGIIIGSMVVAIFLPIFSIANMKTF